jgi:RNA-directed DNA polymerase
MVVSETSQSHLNLTEFGQSLRNEFFNLKTPHDLAELLDISEPDLNYYLHELESSQTYQTFAIPKRSGGKRKISAPIPELKVLQQRLNFFLQTVYDPMPSVHGFVWYRNIVTNSEPHAGKRYILNLDIKDFFPSIHFGRVRGLFMARPYQLPANVATVIAELCCYGNQLPQGAPTSPTVSNMICAKMDLQFQKLAKSCQSTYTRYADDLTFSTTRTKFPTNLAKIQQEENQQRVKLGKAILDILNENGFAVNPNKVRLQSNDEHQEVTGLTSNEFPNVRRTLIREVRAMLHAWRKYGLENAEQHYQQKKSDTGRAPDKGPPNFQLALKGKIEFIGTVRGRNDAIYQKYVQQYKELLNNET